MSQRKSLHFNVSQSGFTLVELMISIVLGLLLVTGLISAFMGSNRSSQLNATLTEMQESGRFTLNTMVSDIRMAGFQGCVNVTDAPAMVRADTAPTTNYLQDSLRAFEVEAADNWNPAPHSSFTFPVGVGEPVPGTHALSVQFASATSYEIDTMPTTSAPVSVIGTDIDIVGGDLALISDCNSADIFHVSSDSGNVLQHASSDNGGDNRLSAPYGQGSVINRTRIMRFEANIYYIGLTGRTNSDNEPLRALYKQALPYSTPPIEMATGVENMRLRLAVEDPTQPGPLTYVEPGDPLLDTHRVRSVQLGFLMQSYDNVASDPDTRSYQIAGYSIPAAVGAVNDGSAHANDNKMRLTFNSSVSIRNR